jgi:hypothetical protein
MSAHTNPWVVAVVVAALILGAILSRVITRGGSRRDGDVAMAVFASYVIGKFTPFSIEE